MLMMILAPAGLPVAAAKPKSAMQWNVSGRAPRNTAITPRDWDWQGQGPVPRSTVPSPQSPYLLSRLGDNALHVVASIAQGAFRLRRKCLHGQLDRRLVVAGLSHCRGTLLPSSEPIFATSSRASIAAKYARPCAKTSMMCRGQALQVLSTELVDARDWLAVRAAILM